MNIKAWGLAVLGALAGLAALLLLGQLFIEWINNTDSRLLLAIIFVTLSGLAFHVARDLFEESKGE